MLELMNKMNEIAKELFEVVPRERLQKLADKILLKPLQRTMIVRPEITKDIQEKIDKFLDEFTSESVAMLAFAALSKSDKAEDISKYMEILDDFDDIKPLIEKFFCVIEEHASAIGIIVEHSILVANSIKNELSDDKNK